MMRNKASKEDMDKVMDLLMQVWQKYPHQRLGQVLLNISARIYGVTSTNVLWNLDENELIHDLEDILTNGW